jgi:hypothetical protein
VTAGPVVGKEIARAIVGGARREVIEDVAAGPDCCVGPEDAAGGRPVAQVAVTVSVSLAVTRPPSPSRAVTRTVVTVEGSNPPRGVV